MFARWRRRVSMELTLTSCLAVDDMCAFFFLETFLLGLSNEECGCCHSQPWNRSLSCNNDQPICHWVPGNNNYVKGWMDVPCVFGFSCLFPVNNNNSSRRFNKSFYEKKNWNSAGVSMKPLHLVHDYALVVVLQRGERKKVGLCSA